MRLPDVGIGRVEFPGFAAQLGDIGTGSRVGGLARVWRRVVLANLIDIERDAMEVQHSGIPAKEEDQTTPHVAAHIETARVMVPEVENVAFSPFVRANRSPLLESNASGSLCP